jgi:hypothetical protein
VGSTYQRSAIRVIQLQRIGQLAHSCGMGRMVSTTLQVGDGAPAHAGTLSKFFLG